MTNPFRPGPVPTLVRQGVQPAFTPGPHTPEAWRNNPLGSTPPGPGAPFPMANWQQPERDVVFGPNSQPLASVGVTFPQAEVAQAYWASPVFDLRPDMGDQTAMTDNAKPIWSSGSQVLTTMFRMIDIGGVHYAFYWVELIGLDTTSSLQPVNYVRNSSNYFLDYDTGTGSNVLRWQSARGARFWQIYCCINQEQALPEDATPRMTVKASML